MRIIKDQKIIADEWFRLVEIRSEDVLPVGNIIVPFDYWLHHKKVLLKREAKFGVCIDGDDDIECVAIDLEHFEILALDFPSFVDGRSFSHARMLRDRYDYKGEIRAVGDVLRDQLFFMQRCGINAFQLRDDIDPEEALVAFTEISVRYQAAADGVEPVYRYR